MIDTAPTIMPCLSNLTQMISISLVYVISAGASPVFGYIVDKTGRNLLWVSKVNSVSENYGNLISFFLIENFSLLNTIVCFPSFSVS